MLKAREKFEKRFNSNITSRNVKQITLLATGNEKLANDLEDELLKQEFARKDNAANHGLRQ